MFGSSGRDLVLRLSMVRRCSLNLSFKRLLVSPIYCKLHTLNHVNKIFRSQVMLDLIVRVLEKKV